MVAMFIESVRPPHKDAPTLRLIKKAGAKVLFLPACSPDLNPIETQGPVARARVRDDFS